MGGGRKVTFSSGAAAIKTAYDLEAECNGEPIEYANDKIADYADVTDIVINATDDYDAEEGKTVARMFYDLKDCLNLYSITVYYPAATIFHQLKLK